MVLLVQPVWQDLQVALDQLDPPVQVVFRALLAALVQLVHKVTQAVQQVQLV
jgi:hypothetical protein